MYRYNKDSFIGKNEALIRVLEKILALKYENEFTIAIRLIDDFLQTNNLFIEGASGVFSTFGPVKVKERTLTDNELECIGILYMEKGELLLLLNVDRKQGLEYIRFSRNIFTRLIQSNPKMYSISWENSLKRCKKLEDDSNIEGKEYED